jgi:transcriptional regulator with XRE-family HTH domain
MDLGFTQHTLASRLGCWDVSVASWERDESVPRSRRWPSLEAVLGPGIVPETEDLPGQLRSRRLRLGLTQEALARRAELDVRTIRNVERGIHPPSSMTIRKLRRVLG